MQLSDAPQRPISDLLISGVTLIDGTGSRPVGRQSILIAQGRIAAIGPQDELAATADVTVVNSHGKYAIPGLMNANVHLLCDVRLENLAFYSGRYQELIAEAAQVALKNGLTTVFDTWGPRRDLIAVRDRIKEGNAIGSRIFCAGNIIGFDGPLSQDFMAEAAKVASGDLINRINATWVENVGRRLMWLTPEEVAREVGSYLRKGIDFLKYASNEHAPGAFLAFSPQTQEMIVAEAHAAGATAQAHIMSIEGLRIAIEAGCDLIQHANLTGPRVIPESTLELMARQRTGAVVFPWTERGMDWIMSTVSDSEKCMWVSSDENARKLIRSGVPLLLANDGAIFAPEAASDPSMKRSWVTAPAEDSLISLAEGHFVWFRAMEEKGMPPMEMLRAATINIATAYGKEKELGTIEPGKIADLLILDKNPLEAAENYRSIHAVIKDGEVVDRDSLPTQRLLTRPLDPQNEEASRYVPFLGGSKFPMCC